MEWTNEHLAHLAFLQHPKIGSRRLRALKERFGTLHRAVQARPSEWEAAGIPLELCSSLNGLRRHFDSDRAIKALEQEHIRLILPSDPEFPPLFDRMSDKAEALFVRGPLKALPWIAFVGSRRMSSYGLRCIQELVPPLVAAGCGIVSGLALGIDGAAHDAALKANGYTIAFLGGGVNDASIYPRTHLNLAHRILEQGGAIVSEFPPHTESRSFHFPLRNRLIAGSCLATVVIEATLESGSLITAKSALEENREVLAVPGPIWNQTSAGCHRLIQAGAGLCTSAADILTLLHIDRPELMATAHAKLPLDAFDRAIIALLTEPRSTDDLTRHLNAPPSQVASALSLLELKGVVEALEGGLWLLCGQKTGPIK
ncbi:DNA-processing protein DprA [Patescibacteria group bacterium]|nr:DNA-processing protein DprA [Patescibacteria group bacterium]